MIGKQYNSEVNLIKMIEIGFFKNEFYLFIVCSLSRILVESEGNKTNFMLNYFTLI